MAITAMLTSQTSDTTSTEITVTSSQKTILIWGTFDGATLEFQFETEADTSDVWIPFNFVRNRPGVFVIELDAGTKVRCKQSGSGTDTNLNVQFGTN